MPILKHIKLLQIRFMKSYVNKFLFNKSGSITNLLCSILMITELPTKTLSAPASYLKEITSIKLLI